MKCIFISLIKTKEGEMKYLLMAAVLVAACTLGAQDFVVKPIMVQDCAPIGESLKFDEKPMGYEPGFKIFFLITGKDMTGFKKDGLSIEYIKGKDGKDISKSRTGKENYKMGSFPKVSDDGKKATFSIESDEDVFGSAESMQIRGKITMVSSTKSETLTSKELDATKNESQKTGNFTVTANPKADADGMMVDMGGNDKSLKVSVQGPMESISNISFVVDGKESKSNGWFGMDNSRTYTLEATKGNKVTVKISYWADMKDTPVPFDIKLGK